MTRWSVFLNPVLIPNLLHGVFQDYEEGIRALGEQDGEDVEAMSVEEIGEKIEKDEEKIRKEARFDPRKVGQDQARQNTTRHLEENDFHFHDASATNDMFLKGKFPCAIRACDKIKRVRVYIRCESFLEWAGWGNGDYGDGGPPETDEDYERLWCGLSSGKSLFTDTLPFATTHQEAGNRYYNTGPSSWPRISESFQASSCSYPDY